MNLWSPLLSSLSPAGAQARLSVLIFHRVLAQPDPLFPAEPDVEQFDRMVTWVKSSFNILPVGDAVQRLKEGRLPSRAACITFDDGYADNCTQAMPVLKKHGLTAGFFVATGFIDGGRMWNDTVIESLRLCRKPELDLSHLNLGCYRLASVHDRRQAIDALLGKIKYLPQEARQGVVADLAQASAAELPTDLMMTSDQVRLMRRSGMSIGAHTVTHPILAGLAPSEVRREIAESKAVLEQVLAERIGLFAYPNGKLGADYRPSDAEIVRELGFDAAFATDWGVAGPACDPIQIPRFTPWDRHQGKFVMRMAMNLVKSRIGC